MTDTKFVLSTPDKFYLPNGDALQLKAVSIARIRASESKARKLLEEKGMTRFKPPEKVVQGVLVAPGVEPITEPYNDETVQDAPDEIKQQYEEYKKNKQALTMTTVGLMFSTLLLRGTVVQLPENGWADAQREDGMEVPTKPDELYVHYLTTEVLIPPAVAQECAMSIVRLSLEGADPEALQAFEDSFRDRKQAGGKPAGNTEDTTEGQLELQ